VFWVISLRGVVFICSSELSLRLLLVRLGSTGFPVNALLVQGKESPAVGL